MGTIKVLIVDDSVVIRKLLTDTLSGCPDIQVVGTASNGKIALARIPQLNPDVLTMDIEMPDMDGLTTLRELRKTWPTLPVIMFSTLTQRGAEATLEALSLGASDYVTKPANVGNVQQAIDRIRAELGPKILALAGAASVAATPVGARPAQPPHRPAATGAQNSPIKALVIASSTGGPNALAEIVPVLPGDIGVPAALVQHMPPVFTKSLADRLNAKSALDVREAFDGCPFRPGTLWIAPGGLHIEIAQGEDGMILRTTEAPPENSCRPAADVLFRSAAAHYGASVLGVVLTGMGQDGLRGCERIREGGGTVFAQDQATSVVWGMPGQVAAAGLADQILPLGRIAPEISRRISAFRALQKPVRTAI